MENYEFYESSANRLMNPSLWLLIAVLAQIITLYILYRIIRSANRITQRDAYLAQIAGLLRQQIELQGGSVPHTPEEKNILQLAAAGKNVGIELANYRRHNIYQHPDIREKFPTTQQ